MRFLSLFSGIEAASTAWHDLGWECVAVADIEAFPSSVLKHHYPNVPNLGDVTKITEMQIAALGPIDAIVFGSPCQDLSVAGKRKGLDGERSGLFFTAIRIIEWARLWNGCRFALWENVPGAFSSNKGRDFAEVVAAMAGLDHVDVPAKGWGTEGAAAGTAGLVEWCVLDAQWFGVAQRRRRVFALADFGDWANRPPILLERESLRGDSAPSREAGQNAAKCLTTGTGSRYDWETEDLIPVAHVGAMPTMRSGGTNSSASHGQVSGDTRDEYVVPVMSYGISNQPTPKFGEEVSPSLDAKASGGGRMEAVAYAVTAFNANAQPDEMRFDPHVAAALTCSQYSAVQIDWKVRRLTPRECERLQGFPDGYTAIPWKRKPANECPDGPRYKALGNSMAVPVMHWIGRNIDFVARWF